MSRALLVAVAAAVLYSARAAWAAPLQPFETDTWATSANGVDNLVLAALRKKSIEPALPCSDEVFIRRVYLDVIGTLPDPQEVLKFLQDRAADKRAKLIEALFQREEFADYWALKWCDVLRVKAEFPVNLWPNAVQAYHRWIRDAVKQNMPYDKFARALLTSSGSNFRVPPVNFYRAVASRDATGIAEAVALTFMGTRLGTWPAEKRTQLAAFFSRVAYKKTGEWKEEIVYIDPQASGPLDAVLPDGTKTTIAPGQDPRIVFADWLISPKNPWFARCVVNRIWAWLFGRGIIHEPDDIRPDNPPSNPELLSYLEKELVAAKYDLRHIYRLILNSRTYQQSCIPRSKDPQAEALFAYYPVRRLDAEVLIDALNWIAGTSESYSSPIPEPFTYIPEDQRTIQLADGSITSSFLEMFGRPPRDTGLMSERSNQPSAAQALYLLNSTDVHERIAKSKRLRQAVLSAQGDAAQAIRAIYLLILSRAPTTEEISAAQKYWETSGLGAFDAAVDLAWALINSTEFLYRH
ncbi:MAG: DUF1553 domain-containing protein [Armatimonadetes bacterium]|nr:DUF1553 domain-containing protein [Armatimonadota bacterium]